MTVYIGKRKFLGALGGAAIAWRLGVPGHHIEVSAVDVTEVAHAFQEVLGKKSGYFGC